MTRKIRVPRFVNAIRFGSGVAMLVAAATSIVLTTLGIHDSQSYEFVFAGAAGVISTGLKFVAITV
jgi:hypothetical protein